MIDPKTATLALARLVDRSGGSALELGYLHEDAPTPAEAGWYASAYFQGTRITAEAEGPGEAAHALARKILEGGLCRCGAAVTLDPSKTAANRCLWTLTGSAWEPGCDAPPLNAAGIARGDLEAMTQAWKDHHGNQ